MLKKLIKTYNNFNSLSIYNIFNKDELNYSLHLKTTTFASLYIENKGNGKSSIIVLLKMIQLSFINNIITRNLNNLNTKIVGNMFLLKLETPSNDSGSNHLPKGKESSIFRPIKVKKSNFFVNKDVRIKFPNKRLKDVTSLANNDVLQSF